VTESLGSEISETVWKSEDPEDIYFALWSLGMNNVQLATEKCKELLSSKLAEVRFCALYYIVKVQLIENQEILHLSIADADSRISTFAINNLFSTYASENKFHAIPDVAYKSLENLLPIASAKAKAEEPIVWSWMVSELRKEDVAWGLIHFLGERSPVDLIKHMEHFTSGQRSVVYSRIAKLAHQSKYARSILADGLSDRSAYVCIDCIQGFENTTLSEEELLAFESLLRRKNNDIRKEVINVILKQESTTALSSANRLLFSSHLNSRNAGIELLRRLAKSQKQQAQEIVSVWLETTRTKVNDSQRTQVNEILNNQSDSATKDSSLGLLAGKKLAKNIEPKPHNIKYFSEASIALLSLIDSLIDKHALDEIDESDDGEERLLGNSFFPAPKPNVPIKEQLFSLPLANIWTTWLENRPETTKDDDRLEWVRAQQFLDLNYPYTKDDLIKWVEKVPERSRKISLPVQFTSDFELKYEYQVSMLLLWLSQLDAESNMEPRINDFTLDAVEDLMSTITIAELNKLKKRTKRASLHRKDWRSQSTMLRFWITQLQNCKELNERQKVRRFQLLKWYQQPTAHAQIVHMDVQYLLEGRVAGVATDADVIFNLVGPRKEHFFEYDSLNLLSSKRSRPEKAKALGLYPELQDIVNMCRDRALEIELARGEQKTLATMIALSLDSVHGAPLLIQLLQLLGKNGFSKNQDFSVDLENRQATFTRLVKRSYPDPSDTSESIATLFRQAIAEKHFPEERLLQLGFTAPQWINAIECYFGWTGLKEAYYWFYAHLKYTWHGIDNDALCEADDTDSFNESESSDSFTESWHSHRSNWFRLIQERTDISDEERSEGVVDIKWFRKTRAYLENDQWDALAAAAQYASSTPQAKQAAYIAEVLTGKADRKKLINGITDRKLKDNVRLLGLLPVSPNINPQKDVLERYEILQDYRQYANQLSTMSKPDAIRAVQIGFDNLARTAGYNDPLRLAWSLEAANTKDLARGFLEVTKGDVTARLDLHQSGKPIIEIKRNQRVLKSIPNSHKKDADIIQLKERAKEIKKQHLRSRSALEEAMNRQFVFVGRELQALSQHAILWPMLSNLVFVGKDSMGFPDKNGKKLRDYNGDLLTVRVNNEYKIAHAHHFLENKDWPAWQEHCFENKREQPFKQVFRELYPLSSQEKKDKSISRRYSGHQINSDQAMALWGNRRWHTKDGVWKSYPDHQFTVSLEFDCNIFRNNARYRSRCQRGSSG